ncbi:MAG: rod shape-determining protein MreC, partial [Patescibacteria group bacterium]
SINKKNNVFIKVLIAFIFLFIFVAFLNLFQDQIKNYFYLVSSPIQKVFWRAGDSTSIFFASLINAKKTEEENEALKLENQSLLIKITALQEQERQNAAINEMISNDPQKEFKLVLAGVAGLSSSQDIILINKGSNDGISEGMPVISQQKVLFGKILKTHKNFSEIDLISNKNNVLNVKIQNNDPLAAPVYGVVRGNSNLEIYLDLVPVDSNINKDDVLVTSALEGIFPKDLLVGRVKEIEKNDLKPFQTIKIEPFFNIIEAGNLFVITDYKK